MRNPPQRACVSAWFHYSRKVAQNDFTNGLNHGHRSPYRRVPPARQPTPSRESCRVANSLKQKVRNTFNVAIAEYGTEDSLTRLRLMVISLSNSEQHLQSRMDKCLAMMEAVCSEEMVYSDLEFINGD